MNPCADLNLDECAVFRPSEDIVDRHQRLASFFRAQRGGSRTLPPADFQPPLGQSSFLAHNLLSHSPAQSTRSDRNP